MLVAMFMIWSTLGSLVFGEVGALAHNLAPATATIICLLLLLGASGKSAQIQGTVIPETADAGDQT